MLLNSRLGFTTAVRYDDHERSSASGDLRKPHRRCGKEELFVDISREEAELSESTCVYIFARPRPLLKVPPQDAIKTVSH